MGVTCEPTAQPTTYARFRWHAACTVSCGGIGQESPIEAVSPQRKTNKSGVTMGVSRCSRVLLLTALVPLAVACHDSAVTLHTSTAQHQAATCNDLIARISSEARIPGLKSKGAPFDLLPAQRAGSLLLTWPTACHSGTISRCRLTGSRASPH
jgi:hypothetical protein